MSPVLYAIFLLQLSSLSTAANFTQVYKWDELDYEWKSEVNKTKALKDGTFNPEKIYPFYMAVYGTRIFLSLASYEGVPVSLVTLPTSSASSAPPKLTPFPSWDINGKKGDCNKIEAAAGLQVDSIGRLWVLDSGSNTCKAKLWITDLINNDQTKLIHRFSFRHNMHDLVLDETPNGTFAYISRINQPIIFVFSLERNESWSVKTPKTRVISIALSPKEEPRKLYLSRFSHSEVYSICVTALRNGTQAANLKFIGKWILSKSYRMLMDNNGTIYAAFWKRDNISSWNSSQPFEEQRFHEVAGISSFWPFTFALDENGTFWMTVLDEERKPQYMLLKDAVGV